MSKFKLVLVVGLFVLMLACAFPPSATPTTVPPTPTPLVMAEASATPPQPTAAPPATDVPAPTATTAPAVVPTATQPPAAAPTTPPQQAAPTIISFTADRMTITEGESVVLSWQASGGSEASIWWVDRFDVMTSAPGPLNPDGGSVTITPNGDGTIVLTVRNSAGEAEARLQLTINCANEWAPVLAGNPPSNKCPAPVQSGPAAQQQFEHGYGQQVCC